VIDVAIVGGGVAGCAAATVLAGHGLSAVVIDRSSGDTPRVGETLPPAVRQLLSELGVWERFLGDGHAPSFGTTAAWGSAAVRSNDFIFNPHGHGWHIDRARFDRMLAAAARDAGAIVHERTRFVAHCRTRHGWELQLAGPAGTARLQARWLVDASGRAARLARANGAERIRYDRLVGIARIHSVESDASEPDSFTLVEAVRTGWWYSAFLPGRRLISVFMTDADLRQRTLDLADAPHTRTRLARCPEASPPFVVSAESARLGDVVGPGWLAVGDAASARDPLSSQGILHALRFGMEAGRAIADERAGDTSAVQAYATAVQQSFRRYLSIRQHYYSLERRWPLAAFWHRRHEPEAADTPASLATPRVANRAAFHVAHSLGTDADGPD